ncbi:hypothetical protein Ahy_A03g010317 isoform D [Arachis hypogaea]|nr:hypothetical protein Ahy_A03g010317 isoform D [Arachis hypogaea]
MVARGVPAEVATTAVFSVAAALNLTKSSLSSSSNWWHDINASSVWQDRSTRSDTIEGAGIWMDDAEGLSLSQFFGEWGSMFSFRLPSECAEVSARDCSTYLARHAKSCFLHNLCTFSSLLGGNLLPGKFDLTLIALFKWRCARAVSTDGLRPSFYSINAVVYVIQLALWLLLWWKPIRVLLILSKVFFAGVSLFAALGFLLYGGR